MSGNVKGITIEFSGDTTKLDQSIRSAEKETAKIDQELNKVNKALRFNPGSIDLLRQKQTLLNQKIQETTAKLQSLKQKQAQMDASGVDKNSKEYRELQREIIATESKLKTFKGQLKAIGNVRLRAASVQLKELGSKATAAGRAMTGVSRAAGVVAGAIGALAYKSGKWADDLNTLSKQYRINTKDLQLYGAAAKLVDTDVTSIAKTHVKLTKNMKSALDGSEKQTEAFEKLGIQITDSNGELRDSDTVWQETIAALGKMSNETERDALAMTLMGGAAKNLNPLIEDGGETYKNVAETMKKYNLDFVTQETLDKANEFNDKIDTIKAVGMLALQGLGAELAGVLAPALEKVVAVAGKFAEWISNLNPKILAVVMGVAALVAGIAPALLLFGALASAAGAVAGVLAGITAPMVAVAAGIAALAVVIGTALAKSEPFRNAMATLGQTLVSVFLPVIKQIVSTFKQLFGIIGETVTEVANDLAPIFVALTPIITKVAKLIANLLINKLKGVILVAKLLAVVIKTLSKGIAAAFTSIAAKAVSMYTKIRTTFSRVKQALVQPFEAAKNKIKSIIDAIKGFFGNLKVSAPHIPLPHFKIKPAGWDIGDLVKGKIPSLSVDWYAKGGIFNRPTVLTGVGEAGPEAVVPLNTLWQKLDNIALAAASGNLVINNYGDASPYSIAQEVKRVLINEVKRGRQAWQ